MVGLVSKFLLSFASFAQSLGNVSVECIFIHFFLSPVDRSIKTSIWSDETKNEERDEGDERNQDAA